MSLHYRIYWIDDNIEDAIDAGIKSEFEDYLEKLGFKPEIVCFENGKTALERILRKESKIDLILSDYNIDENGQQGDDLIREIRNGNVYSEVLFYSAQTNFDEIAKSLYLDRISFLSLQGDSAFRSFKKKVYWLIGLTIEKLQEINNIRGLVMAETSSLDQLMVDILGNYFDSDDEHAAALRRYILEIINKSAKSNVTASNKFSEKTSGQVLTERLFDADKKARTINKLLKLKGLDGKYENFYDRYKERVITYRNDLAHAKSENIDGTEYLILSRQDGESSLKWTQQECVNIRTGLREIEQTIHNIRKDMIKSA